jgi:3-dehydroquinate dehydratase / shikimate dehydrogenase
MTFLCVPIFVTEFEKAKRDIVAAGAAGAELIELRIDTLRADADLDALLKSCPLPAIVTCRPTWEGGLSELDDPARAMCLATGIRSGAKYADVEFKTSSAAKQVIENARKDSKNPLILSCHDFQGIPDDICRIVDQMNLLPGDVNKIVWTAKNIRENLDAFRLLHNPKRPTVALCMGEAGLISRVLAKKFGAFLTFASLEDSQATAPGQVTISDMKKLYRWDAIGAETKVFGVVAHPVRHSMSPAIHNAGFGQIGFDGVYLPMLVQPGYENFKAFMEDFRGFEGMNLSGLSVTIPHKENALRYLIEIGGEVEELARKIGAVNTIMIDSATISGKNTDYTAILDCITEALHIARDQLGDLRVAILGAGGTARAAVAGLAHYGASVIVYNRTAERAESLAREFGGHTGTVTQMPLAELCRQKFDVLINTTSVGMFPSVDANPLEDCQIAFSGNMLVFDTVYNPVETKLLVQVKARGAQTISGVEMFVKQAAAQFETWTKTPAPIELMREVILARIGRSG